MDESPSWHDEYPFKSHYLEADGYRYHFLDEGEGDPVLMVHGNPTWSFYWRRLVLALSPRQRAIAVDHLGCGLSDKPLDYPYRLEDHVANLAGLVQTLDLQNITLVVHDWGGPIGLSAALQLQERIGRLVILNTGAFPPPSIPLRIRCCRIPLLGNFMVRRLNLFARLALKMATHRKQLSKPARDGLLSPYDSYANRIAIARFIEQIPSSPGHPNWQLLCSLEKQLQGLSNIPTRIIWGMKDWCFTPHCLDRLMEIFPHADVTRLEDVGHYVMEENPDRVIQLVSEFLQT
ncbi:MAG: alpha/beta hydrolase [Planctomycetaceae bacterium]|nr:alpha/beta hydrolase [Planctomycetaceae bacterium]|tara:strand:- start:2172 stop:3041 length:870 start_codon:yes stop_codon:yes gene_type:complete